MQLKDNATKIYLTLYLNETSNNTYLEEITQDEFYNDYHNDTIELTLSMEEDDLLPGKLSDESLLSELFWSVEIGSKANNVKSLKFVPLIITRLSTL